MKIYISGPMTGYDDYNFPAFNQAAMRIRMKGHSPINPAAKGVIPGWTWKDYLRCDLGLVITEAEAVAVLPNWEKSRGARLEVHVARELGLPILDVETLQEYHEPITLEAHRLVSGDRNADYGHPLDDFAKTAKIWTGVLLPKLRDGLEITPEEVGLCMVGVKLSREINRPKRDNLVDIAGYAQTLDMIAEERARRKEGETPCDRS